MAGNPTRNDALSKRRGEYGFDIGGGRLLALLMVLLLGGGGGLALLTLAVLTARSRRFFWSLLAFVGAFPMLFNLASYTYTTRIGKFSVWADILCGLHLSGDESVLDLGCGRGAVLMMAAKLVPRGRAVGVDLWKMSDQSGNSAQSAQQNAELEGVADRVDLETADMRSLPFSDCSFDLIVSSLAIHNIPEAEGRLRAIDEAIRVLKPGGRLLVADIFHTAEYAQRLREQRMQDVEERALSWRFWYGGPWMAPCLISAAKPV
jgi:arsenite methyltransferase